MLLTPLVLQDPSVRRQPSVPNRRANRPGADRSAASWWPTLLVAWAILGIGVLLCVPSARGGSALGGTLPFWLVAAPLIDLGWCKRRMLADAARGGVHAWRPCRRTAAVRYVVAAPSRVSERRGTNGS